MNKRQRLVQEQFLNDEEEVIRKLKVVYKQSLDDITKKSKELQDRLNTLDALEGMTSDPEELARLKSMKQSKVYQKQYQDALKKQVSSILDNMQVEEFKTVSDYLTKCYEEGFLGTMYDLHGQGIPLIMPMDQEAIVRAVQLDSKIKEGYYQRLGEDVSLLKKSITAEVSRGISTGASFSQVAQQIKAKMTGIYDNKSGGALYRAETIARTEGHRIQVQSTNDACYKAKEKGADVVKQWDSTLDSRTRESHQKVDGEIRELDKPFSNGLMFPGDPSGGASEVVNCRCALLQRARWALDGDELETLKKRAAYFELDKSRNFEEFKKKYLNATGQGLAAKIGGGNIPEHEEPKYVGAIKYSDKAAVMRAIKAFEGDAAKETVENAYVITTKGEIYHCYGLKDRVFPDYDLKDKIYGATISHNHPIEETMFTFSSDDLELFMRYDLEVLRGCDEKYVYEFTKDASLIDEMPDDWMNFENFEHGRVIEKAKTLGIGYRRWLNE